MANWFYVVGSLCFLAGTVINMVNAPKVIKGLPLYTNEYTGSLPE